jgi:membrane-associated phospholipid phosphatase
MSMRRKRKIAGFIAAAAVVVGAAAPATAAAAATGQKGASPPTSVAFSPGSGQSVVDWNHELITILGTPGAQPATVHSTRSFAILQAAEYDAVVSITRAAAPYLFSVAAPAGARPDAAADQAAHDVLAALYPTQKGAIDQVLAGQLAAIPNTTGKQQGIEVGADVASRLVALRSTDGSALTPPPFVPGTQPGDYRPTPPNFPTPVFTNWGTITPFVLDSGSQFRPPAPPPITGPAYARALNQVKSLGQDTSTTRTADETTQAQFWGASPIWNTWNEIAQKLAVARSASLERTVTVFENLDLSLADATIALYDAKYHYLVWRPVTAIELGNTIGNPGITGNPTWLPLAVTAPDPSYPGAHATISEAAATVLSAFYGERLPLTVTSDGDPGVTRSFGSFQAAADEATLSRLFAGQHTMIDLVAGQHLGQQVAQFVLGHLHSAPDGG